MVEYFTGAVVGAAVAVSVAGAYIPRSRVPDWLFWLAVIASPAALALYLLAGGEPVSHWWTGFLIGAVFGAVGVGINVAVQNGMSLPNRSDEYDEKIKAAQEAGLPFPDVIESGSLERGITDVEVGNARPASCPCGDSLCLKYGCPYSPQWKGDGCR